MFVKDCNPWDASRWEQGQSARKDHVFSLCPVEDGK